MDNTLGVRQKELITVGELIKFSNREEFRSWLSENCRSDAGVWLLLERRAGPKQ